MAASSILFHCAIGRCRFGENKGSFCTLASFKHGVAQAAGGNSSDDALQRKATECAHRRAWRKLRLPATRTHHTRRWLHAPAAAAATTKLPLLPPTYQRAAADRFHWLRSTDLFKAS